MSEELKEAVKKAVKNNKKSLCLGDSVSFSQQTQPAKSLTKASEDLVPVYTSGGIKKRRLPPSHPVKVKSALKFVDDEAQCEGMPRTELVSEVDRMERTSYHTHIHIDDADMEDESSNDDDSVDQDPEVDSAVEVTPEDVAESLNGLDAKLDSVLASLQRLTVVVQSALSSSTSPSKTLSLMSSSTPVLESLPSSQVSAPVKLTTNVLETESKSGLLVSTCTLRQNPPTSLSLDSSPSLTSCGSSLRILSSFPHRHYTPAPTMSILVSGSSLSTAPSSIAPSSTTVTPPETSKSSCISDTA